MLIAAAPVVSSPPASVVAMADLGGILVVPVTIGGKGPYHFVLDSGAGITVIAPRLAEELHLATEGSKPVSGVGDAQTQMQLLTLSRVAVGAAEQTNVAGAIIPLPASLTYQGKFGRIDGILGYTFLKSYALTLDIARGTASFASAFEPPAGATAIPLELAEGAIPAVGVDVDGKRGRFEIDSGNNGPMVLTAAFSDANGIAARYQSAGTSQFTGVGGTVRTTQIRIASVLVGGASLHAIAADVSPATASVFQKDGLDGALGYDVLRRFVVTLDYPHERLYLVPNAGFDAYEPVAGTGVTVERTDAGAFLVIRVDPQSPAGRAGVAPGETIVAIDGHATADLSGGEYHDLAGRAPGQRVTFTLLSANGTRRDLTMISVDRLPPAT